MAPAILNGESFLPPQVEYIYFQSAFNEDFYGLFDTSHGCMSSLRSWNAGH